MGRRARLIRAARRAYFLWEEAFSVAIEANCAIVFDAEAAAAARDHSLHFCRRYALIEATLAEESELDVNTVHSCILHGSDRDKALFANVDTGLPLIQSLYPEATPQEHQGFLSALRAAQEVLARVPATPPAPTVSATVFGSGMAYMDREAIARWQREQRHAA